MSDVLSYDPRVHSLFRVSMKALIFDDQKRLLVLRTDADEWQIPGGGIKYGEEPKEALRREIHEEIGVTTFVNHGIQFLYTNKHEKGYMKLCVAWTVSIQEEVVLTHNSDSIVDYAFVTETQFMQLPFEYNEQSIKNHVDEIWRKK